MANALFEKPIRGPSSWEEVLKAHFKKEAAKIRTTIPARVIEVDYTTGMVLVQPLIRTWWEKYRSEVSMWPLEGIPIIFSSAKRGVARITLPVSKGDVGLVLFADRHTENYLGSEGEEVIDSGSMTTLGVDGYMNVIGFLPEVFTESKKKAFDSENLLIEHGTSEIKLSEIGEVSLSNDVASSTITAEGECTVTNGSGTIKLLPDGTINLNGFIINPDGSATSPVSVSAPTIGATASLTVAGKEQKEHIHLAGTYVDSDTTPITGTSGIPV